MIWVGLLICAVLLGQANLAKAEDPQYLAPADEESAVVQNTGEGSQADPTPAPQNEPLDRPSAGEKTATQAIPVVQEIPVSPETAVTSEQPKGAPKLAPVVDDSKYTLGVNDVIEITVARHPEVSGPFIVNKEGKIQFNFVGDITIEGLTKDKVKNLLSEQLSQYIVTPDVTVKITGYNSKIVYVIGEVGRPGRIYMRGDTISVREALLEAGLPLLSASTRKSRLVTPAKDGKAKTRYVNVEALLYDGDLNENLVMRPGDTLYIPATIMAKAMRVISPVTQPVGEMGSAARTVYTGGF